MKGGGVKGIWEDVGHLGRGLEGLGQMKSALPAAGLSGKCLHPSALWQRLLLGSIFQELILSRDSEKGDESHL